MSDTPKHILQVIKSVEKKGLKSLDLNGLKLSGNRKLKEIPFEIFDLPQLEALDIRNNELVSIPPDIRKLTNLTALHLGHNELTSLPSWLDDLKYLTVLDLPYNKLKNIPSSISRLDYLTHLNLANNEELFYDKNIELPISLISLSLSGNQLAELSKSLAQLRKLLRLDLNNNKLSNIPDWLSQLKNLTHLNLNNNELDSIPDVIFSLKKLTELELAGNKLTSIPDAICKLENLSSLWLNKNEIDSLPESISDLKKLNILGLGNNHFDSIPEIVYELTTLEELTIGNTLDGDEIALLNISRNNNQFYYRNTYDQSTSGNTVNRDKTKNRNSIKQIHPQILRLTQLKRFDISNNPIEMPPPEIVKEGFIAIKNYFKQLETQGVDYLYEAKLLLIGEGGAGKTTLARKIQNPNYVLKEEKSTEGIEVIQVTFSMENGHLFRVNIWDFGGQEIYHATHQFFLTKRSLYLLVADTRKEDTDFYYWLNVVDLLSENSPLLIIENQKQDRHREINIRQLRGQFDSLKDTLPTNLATNRGLSEIIAEIKHHISKLSHIGTPLPRGWVKVRERLEKDPYNYISLDKYLEMCEQNGFKSMRDKLQLSGYLHDLGVCLHFQEDALLKKTVILKPKWGTDAVYKVLDNKTVINNFGKFNKTDLASIWHEDTYANMLDELLQLMINFKLCYKIPNIDFFIAPQLLSENQPHYNWEETENLILRYTYEFMPKGIITQFIVATHTFIAEQNLVWKSGVILKRDQTEAEVVEFYGKREIKIRVIGKHKKELMTIVTYELDRIHSSYKRLKSSKFIPCNCKICKDSQDPYFYEFEILQRFIDDGQKIIQCQRSYQMVSSRSLIDDIIVSRESGDQDNALAGQFIIQGNVGKVTVLHTERGDNIMKKTDEKTSPIRSAWANGSFYLVTFAVVIAGLGVLANTVPIYALAAILIAGVLFVPLIGVLQLRQDDRLSEVSFIELMKMVIGQLPLIGKVVNQSKESSDK